jgi:putative transposase
MFVSLRDEHYVLWRAVDEHGADLDILPQTRRDKAAALRFFKRVLRPNPVPHKIVTDQLCGYSELKADIPAPAHVKHVFVKAAAPDNTRAQNSPQRTRKRERRMRGFSDRARTQAFLSSFGPIRRHFTLNRHLLRAPLVRKQLAVDFAQWREFTNVTQTPSHDFLRRCGFKHRLRPPPQVDNAPMRASI